MRRFITIRKKKVLRYKLYYFCLVFLILMIFLFNILVNFLLNHVSEDNFLNVLVGNSFGNVTEYQMSNLKSEYFYRNSFGFVFQDTTLVMEEDSYLPNVVYIYNTFQTKHYLSNYFHSYSTRSYVTQASYMLSEYLKEERIGSVVESESVVKIAKEKDIPYTNSYAASRILLELRKEEYKELEYFFDLQISDYEREDTTTSINGLDYARVLFVVGTDNENYLDNEMFARDLNYILESIYSSLSRGVSLRGGVGYQGVYNQDFSSNALLIQVGGVDNTIDEVNRTIKVLAQVIATYIMEDNYEEK